MRLVLSVSGKVLDSIELGPQQVKDKDYLSALRRLLYVKNELSIMALRRHPEFYIEASSMFNSLEYGNNA